jgi:hypothetical protein
LLVLCAGASSRARVYRRSEFRAASESLAWTISHRKINRENNPAVQALWKTVNKNHAASSIQPNLASLQAAAINTSLPPGAHSQNPRLLQAADACHLVYA